MFLLALISPVIQADTVISSESIELTSVGNFDDSSQWEISSTAGFSNNPADYTIGMIADNELSFTHIRPANFETQDSWASDSITGSNYSLGVADTSYTWSKGPNISVDGFSYPGLYDKEIENVSLVLHFEIPNILYQDTVQIVLQGSGSDKLVREIARTSSGIFRMNNPLVIGLDDLRDWTWNEIVNSQVTINYESVGNNDDSEVRVDAVGIRVKYHMPWYSFENIKAIHAANIQELPIIDFSPYDGDIEGLNIESCGLTPNGANESYWEFEVDVPYGQELGRIHVYGTGNYSIGIIPENVNGNFSPKQSGDLIDNPTEKQFVRIEIFDGCIEAARVDINDPKLVVNGKISGSTYGLSSASNIRFAIGEYIIETVAMESGDFSLNVPIGHAFPLDNSESVIGIASRFQWSSDGNAETTVVHIEELTITGGFKLEYDYSPTCQNIANLEMTEDEGGFLMSLPCNDDITPRSGLLVQASSSNDQIVRVDSLYSPEQDLNFIQLQTVSDASGEVKITVEVYDIRRSENNKWMGVFTVNVEAVSDAPVIAGLPNFVYIDLGDSLSIAMNVYDVDSENMEITTSKSWALIDENHQLILTPIDSGIHTVNILVSDGDNTVSGNITVDVSAKPDLLIESLSVRKNGADISTGEHGDIVEIISYIRNEGRGVANSIDVRCYVDDILIGTKRIDTLQPGSLVSTICDTSLSGNDQDNEVRIIVDSTYSIEESNENNNQKAILMFISAPSEEENKETKFRISETLVIILSFIVIIIGLVVLQLSPGKVRKPYEKRK
tara:strand:- start:674 stop:3031 length:2358 start_codon:yes stop_codon:yes gene_type:complete